MVSGGSGWGSGGRGRGEEVALATDLRQGVDAFVNYPWPRTASLVVRGFSFRLGGGFDFTLTLRFARPRWCDFCRLVSDKFSGIVFQRLHHE